MKLTDLKFLKEIKIGDFALYCMAVLSLLYPGIICLYLIDRGFLIDNSFFSVFGLSVSIGFVLNIMSMNMILVMEIDDIKDSEISFKNIKRLMPVTIFYQAMLFSKFILLFILLNEIAILKNHDLPISMQVAIFIGAFYGTAIIDVFLKKRKNGK